MDLKWTLTWFLMTLRHIGSVLPVRWRCTRDTHFSEEPTICPKHKKNLRPTYVKKSSCYTCSFSIPKLHKDDPLPGTKRHKDQISHGECLKCFECDNKFNPACGVEFKSYQFEARPCAGEMVKCGLQRQPPQAEKDNFIGILRRCYHLGSLPSINESDGCHFFNVAPQNYSLEICFCSEDYCNSASTLVTDMLLPVLLCAYVLGYRMLKAR